MSVGDVNVGEEKVIPRRSDVSRYFSGEKNCQHLAMVDEKGVSE